MHDFSRVQNYYIACGYTDMRKQIDGLAALVQTQFGQEMDETSLYLFCGRRADRIKALYWDGTGYMERAKAKVVKHYRKVYADRQLEQETGYSEEFKPVVPPPLLAHSYASASVVADVLMKKYVDAMPLYRQEQMWKRMGVALKRGTMAIGSFRWLTAIFVLSGSESEANC